MSFVQTHYIRPPDGMKSAMRNIIGFINQTAIKRANFDYLYSSIRYLTTPFYYVNFNLAKVSRINTILFYPNQSLIIITGRPTGIS